MKTKLASSFLLAFAFAFGGCAESTGVPIGAGGSLVITPSSSSGTGGGGDGGDQNPDGGSPCLHQSDCTALNDACNVGSCVNNVCVKTPGTDGATCDDGLYCTVDDVCMAGVCAGSPRVCNGTDGGTDPCQAGMCNEQMQTCVPMPGNDGATCTPMDPCFTAGECAGGSCIGTTAVDCSSQDSDCATATCVNGDCQVTPTNEGGMCNTQFSDPCSPSICQSGACNVMPMADGTACSMGFTETCNVSECMNGTCSFVPSGDGTPCSDGFTVCNLQTCVQGTCTNGAANPCGPTNGCWTNSCDPNAFPEACASVMVADGTPCSDGDVCNTGKTCKTGICQGGTPAHVGMACTTTLSCDTGTTCSATGQCTGGTTPNIFFQEEFNDNSQGWTLGAEWQIGATMASDCQDQGFSDPSYDTPFTPANGVAGVVLGGCPQADTMHPMQYLTSPAFDTSAATGSVILGFYRLLNADFIGNMSDEIDVFDGTTWQTVWTDEIGVTDPAWVYVSYDVTQYKNSKMQVRFGFDVETDFGDSVSSWNIDDVIVSTTTCQ